MFDEKCRDCGAPANFSDGDKKLCWKCVEVEAKQRRADIRAGRVKWGPWRFKASNLTIIHDDGYDVDLERCQNSARVLDWIGQVANKGCYSDEEIGQLVRAMNEVIDFQGRLCGGGKDAEFDAKAVLRSPL